MNYKKLLKKYMAHILHEEGITFVDRLHVDFTDDEVKELEEMAEDLGDAKIVSIFG